MFNPLMNTEALNSATYVDNYIESVENLPEDIQLQLSRIRDIDVEYRTHLRDVEHYYDLWKSLQSDDETVASRRSRAISRIKNCLLLAQELGDEKLLIVNNLQEMIDLKTRQLDVGQKNLDYIDDNHQRNDMQSNCSDEMSVPPKMLRTQSPPRGGSTSGGCSTPNSERSSNANNCVLLSGANRSSGNSNSSGSVSLNSSNIGSSKRSRRRNDNVNHNIALEVGGNESNSANESGNICGSDRGALLRNSTASVGVHKKSTSHIPSGSMSHCSGGGGGSGSGANSGCGNNSTKKKKRKARGTHSTANNTREETPPPDSIDPDEPTYCICNQISFGEMILCDNDLCPIEWFHFSCVSLVLKPKGRWYCPNCRGERPNVMKPKAQFLKELERYNKEKEEKT